MLSYNHCVNTIKGPTETGGSTIQESQAELGALKNSNIKSRLMLECQNVLTTQADYSRDTQLIMVVVS